MPSPLFPRQTGRGFTLVELLVVIGIIAVLISILLPALGRARRSAQTTACMSNLRQIGIAYRFYAEANKGLMPFVVNPNWQSYIGSDPNNRLYWFKALTPYLSKGADPLNMSSVDSSAVFTGCPAWPNWIDPTNLADGWRQGYGQNVYLYAGFYNDKVFPRGAKQRANVATFGWSPEFNIEPLPTDTSNNWSVGQIKLAAITKPATRIIAGDSVQYWLGLTSDARAVFTDPLKKEQFGLDFTRYVSMSTPDPAFQVTGWVSGHPTRHGGELNDCKPNMSISKQYNAKSNYLFADGHVMTLDYVEARRALQAKP